MGIFDIFRRKKDESYYHGEKEIISQHKFSTIEEIIEFMFQNQSELNIILYNKASDEEVELFEQSKIHLPDDIKQFYKFCNGFYSNEDMFRIIPLNEIIDNGDDEYLKNKTSFHIGEYMIYCDLWTIDINPNNKNDYIIYQNTGERIIILTKSFVEFLECYINRGVYEGLYNWAEIKKPKSGL
ncbi:SMI1/KNR4 family protein SUKH-1 [Arcicella aurantiaca]|jgi:hypothetical protein|uniref:SMI1/KNR4 family protein SUKH-1 n=1 Tax=Arcicella aurantiaca TaxID=591202 RepID=A0A316EBV1_9BACT|nr:SMI1/KNR4 family protein [Arcicella aurantiaca]PWK27938.1 SMI1/KNR4 family protein SUKH-1 [Arcicella aurantiaca]